MFGGCGRICLQVSFQTRHSVEQQVNLPGVGFPYKAHFDSGVSWVCVSSRAHPIRID